MWQILLRIGTDDNGKASRTMSLNQLLETGIITAAYPVHDGNIKHTEGEDLNNTNDRRVNIKCIIVGVRVYPNILL